MSTTYVTTICAKVSRTQYYRFCLEAPQMHEQSTHISASGCIVLRNWPAYASGRFQLLPYCNSRTVEQRPLRFRYFPRSGSLWMGALLCSEIWIDVLHLVMRHRGLKTRASVRAMMGGSRSDCGFFLIAHDCFEFIFPRICVVCLIIFPNDVCAYV